VQRCQTFIALRHRSDPETGTLPPGAFSTWQIDFTGDDQHGRIPLRPHERDHERDVHDCNRGETSANVFYRVMLTVRDPAGFTSDVQRPAARTSRSPWPRRPGLQVTLDGQPGTTPASVLSVEVIRT
jgi:hypothetical protein